MAIVILFLP